MYGKSGNKALLKCKKDPGSKSRALGMPML